MKDLIIRILREFKADDNGEPLPFPERKPRRPGYFYKVSDVLKDYPNKNEHYYDTVGGRWHIKPATVRGHPDGDWSFTHEDYDGAPYETGGPPADLRHGHAKSAEACADEIDNAHSETHDRDIFD